MAAKPNDVDLGPFEVKDLALTAQLFAGLGADDRLPPDVRFLSNVAKLIQQRKAVDSEASDPNLPAVFLLAPTSHKSISEKNTRVPMLNNGASLLNGRVWLVAQAVNSGYKLEAKFDDDEELFGFITDTLQLGDVPTIIYEPRSSSPTIRFYRDGLKEPEECEIFPASGEEVTDEKIFAVIERVYQQCLKTPDAQSPAGKLWHNSDLCWPSSNAEAVVQLNLKAGLVARFFTCIIREEQSTAEGRTDLEIEEKVLSSPGTIIRHALIELKVLRSFRESGSEVPHSETLDRIASGVDQAYVYGKNKDAKLATLCCFDMRTEDDKGACFKYVLEKALRLEVVLKRWFIYSSSEHYRKAMAS